MKNNLPEKPGFSMLNVQFHLEWRNPVSFSRLTRKSLNFKKEFNVWRVRAWRCGRWLRRTPVPYEAGSTLKR